MTSPAPNPITAWGKKRRSQIPNRPASLGGVPCPSGRPTRKGSVRRKKGRAKRITHLAPTHSERNPASKVEKNPEAVVRAACKLKRETRLSAGINRAMRGAPAPCTKAPASPYPANEGNTSRPNPKRSPLPTARAKARRKLFR